MFCNVERIVILRHITRKSRLSLFSIMLSSLQYALHSLRSRHSFSFVSACYFRHGPVRSQRAIRGGSKRRIEIVTTAKVTSLTLVRFSRNSTFMHFESSNTESALWETNSRIGRFWSCEESARGIGGQRWKEKDNIDENNAMQDKRKKFEIKNIFNDILSNKYLYIKIIG